MSNEMALHGACPVPFFDEAMFKNSTGFVGGRLCQKLGVETTCCLPCPLTKYAYPDSFETVGLAAEWVAVVSTIICCFLLISWAFLPVDKTHRHYLSISLTVAVVLMNLGFVVPLAAQPAQCADEITPHGQASSSVCGASGAFLIVGGWGGVMWVFLRSLSLHLQICWQAVVGRNFMWFSQAVGWGIPIIGVTIALTVSGVSFRFGSTCHINHQYSLAVLWIPLLVFAGLTIIIQLGTFGYCIKVYLASLNDNAASTEGSGLPSYTNSIRTMTPRQAYRRVRRVIQLQWRGIAIVLIIIADVIFFSIVFVFQDNTVESVKHDSSIAEDWVVCLFINKGDKDKCLDEAGTLVVNEATVAAVLLLLAVNGLWLMLLLGRWTMVTTWLEMVKSSPTRNKREFVSVDARLDDLKKETRSYEMLSRDSGKNMDDAVTPSVVSPLSPAARLPSSPDADGRRTPDYFGHAARYQPSARSFSTPKPPQQVRWDPQETYALPSPPMRSTHSPDAYDRRRDDYQDINPLGMNRI